MLTVVQNFVLRHRHNRKVRASLRDLIDRDGLTCYWCGRVCILNSSPNSDRHPTRDHYIRKADGGSDDLSNLVLACRKCNSSRHAPDWHPNKPATPPRHKFDAWIEPLAQAYDHGRKSSI